ncbi:hypothetical protein G6K97_21585 [Agrobacterium rhizogenes]|uniref:hypothetical protein n=1 Tax=Rhizobium rhizogenes TaxID=359 RepID=UPI0015733068|nr:hypothetical protein [Rhizobium rhizogenes]NTH85737.1 hypothetical protein [Rhizobium rhizogenes]
MQIAVEQNLREQRFLRSTGPHAQAAGKSSVINGASEGSASLIFDYDFQPPNKSRSNLPFGLSKNRSLNNFETTRGRKPTLSSISTTENFFISMVIVRVSSQRRYVSESSELKPFCVAHAAIACAVMTCPIAEMKTATMHVQIIPLLSE